jgi:hypothetical protein
MIINIRVSVKKLLKEKYNIAPEITEEMFKQGILKDYNCRDMLIRDEFIKKSQPKEKQMLRNKLASKYCVSVKTIEKITLGLFL